MAEEKGNSELTQEVEALKNVSKNLAELLTNSVNMVDKYYEIFFDQNPHYVKLEQYDKNGILHTTLVPNRAMDKSVALSGTEDPEGVIDAAIGTLYVNSVTRELFMKKTTKGNIGWVNITPQPIEIYKETFKVNSKTQTVSLLYKAYAKEYVDVFLNGIHLEQADYDLDTDQQTLIFNTKLSNDSTLQVSYMTGLYGIKGDTALTFKIGEVRTVPTGELAKVENVGTGEDIILDFDIPTNINITGVLPVGSEVVIPASSNYAPEGCLLKDGSAYTKEQFPDLWDNYLSYDVVYSNSIKDWTTHIVGSNFMSYYAITYGNNMFIAVGDSGQIATSTDGTKWTKRQIGTNNYYAITYGDGVFVGVGGAGEIATSTDGTKWTTKFVGSSSYHAITYDNGVFVAVGYNGQIATSANGIDWEIQTVGSERYEAIAYGNNKFVAVGYNGQISTSTNGIDWETQTIGRSYFAIIYANNMFVAVGNAGQIATSTNGIDWETQTVGSKNYNAITYANNKFVAVGNSGQSSTSIDGLFWETQTIRNYVVYNAITYGNGVFVAVGKDNYSVASTSIDGTKWTTQRVGNNTADYYAITYGDNKFVAVGTKGELSTAPMNIETITGKVLSLKTYADYDAQVSEFGVCESFGIDIENGRFRVPYKVSSKRFLVKSYQNGSNWYNLYSDGWCEQGGEIKRSETTQSILLHKTYKNNNYSIFIQPYSTIERTDGIPVLSYEAPSKKTTSEFIYNSYTNYSGCYWRTCGYTSTVHSPAEKYYVSVANIQINQSQMDWSAWASSLQGKQNVIADLDTIREGAELGATYMADKPNLALKSELPTKTSQLTNDSDYITSEYHDSTKQDVLTAGDNITIENNTISAKAGGLPVGSEVVIPASSDYVPEGCLLKDGSEYTKEQFPDLWDNYLSYDVIYSDWTTKTVGSKAYQAITYGDNKFVAVGDFGQISTSTDGIDWTTKSVGAWYYAITYANNMFVAVGANGQIATSTDGTNWKKQYVESNGYYAITYGDNKFVAVGQAGRITTSTKGIDWTTKTVGDIQYNAITYGNNKFVAVGGLGQISTSPNGIDWTTQTVGSDDYYAIAYGGGLFVAVGGSDFYGQIATSTNGIDWETQTVGKKSYQAITYGNSTFVAVSDSGQISTMEGTITESVLSSITYADYETQVSELGVCESFGIDIENGKFKVPYKVSSSAEKYYIAVANTQVNQSQMDWSAWASSLQGKADKSEIPDISNLATKEEVSAIASAGLKREVVNNLPSISAAVENTIYLVPSEKQEDNNVRDEYLFVNGAFELIGTTKIDLSNYYNKNEINTKLGTKQDIISDLETIRSNANLVITKQDVIDDLDEIRSGANKGSTALQSIPSEYVTETELNNKGYLTSYTETDPIYIADKPNLALKSEIPDISNLATKDEIPDVSGKADKSTTYTKTEIDNIISSNLGNIETLLREV